MNNLMLDMEFLDTEPSAAIVSIGAIFFDPVAGKLGNSFYTNVSADDCVRRHGMTISADTIRWWVDQDIKAIRDAFAIDKVMMLELALVKFGNFVSQVKRDDLIIHAQGSLDFYIMKNAWAKLPDPNAKLPWLFRNERDLRTLRALYPNIDVPRVGKSHNALDDATYQANVAIEIYQHISGVPSDDLAKIKGKFKVKQAEPVDEEL